MGSGKQLTVNSKQTLKVGRLTVNSKRLTVLVISFILLVSFVTVAIATGFFGINTTKVSSLEKGLVGHWMLDAENGAKDLTPYGNHGTAQGGITIGGAEDRKGKSGGATSFDGSGTYIDLDNSKIFLDKNKPFTISIWFKHSGVFSSSAKYQRLVELIVDGYANCFSIVIGNSEGYDGVYYGGSGIIYPQLAGFKPTANEWNYLTLTYNGNGMTTSGNYKLYLNGTYIPVTVSTHAYSVSTQENFIGRRGTTDSFFNGQMQDVRIYNRALSEDEIKLLFDSYKPKASASDLNKGLVGHWMLDAENGAKDLTPYGNHGTAQGGITIGGAEDRKGKSGGATSFDGVDDYIEIQHKDELMSESITVSGWIYLKGRSSNWMLIDKGFQGTSYSKYYMYGTTTNDNKWSIFGPTGTRYDISLGSLDLEKWYFLAGTFDANTGIMKAYKNGELSGIKTSAQLGLNTFNVMIGKYGDSGGYYPNGSISDVRIYNRALSEDEIQLLFDSYKPKEASVGNLNKGLVLDMPLTTKWMKSSTIVSDRTPYGNDGTLMNGVNITNEGAVFDGVNDYVEIKNFFDSNNIQDFSYNLWIKRNGECDFSYSNWLVFMGYKYATEAINSLRLNNDYKLRFYGYRTNSGNYNYNSNFVMDLNEWYNIAFTYNSSSMKFYIDGDLFAQTNMVLENTVSSQIFILGGLVWTTEHNRAFNGTISNVRIYNRALSDEEVKLLYEKGRW